MAENKRLPVWISIESGDHTQFGWYFHQLSDNPATISREEQQAQIVPATVAVLVEFK
jgi:hypothetical protein